jgi:hypothetical protein
MRPDADPTRRPPRERFAGSEHVFNLRGIAAGLRNECAPVRGGHRQMTIYHKMPFTLVLFDFEAGARLTDHQADAQVTILALTGLLEVTTPAQTHQLPEGSLLVLEPGRATRRVRTRASPDAPHRGSHCAANRDSS